MISAVVHIVGQAGDSLHQLTERREEIEAEHEANLERAAKRIKPNRPLLEVLSDALDADDDEERYPPRRPGAPTLPLPNPRTSSTRLQRSAHSSSCF
ncbi:hypothetical protein [Streptomyces sp. NPDC058092]|uniref:hypothetical protein n=1 Tax=Streptomyces sp. NPDC058092 TaxID=3346336 RepID=UPI0036F0CB3D